MYHSVTFGSMNTWNNWHLIPTSRPVFNPPEVKTQYVDIPGGNGVLDLTESLNGRVKYGQRKGSMEFVVYTDSKYNNQGDLRDAYGQWQDRYMTIANYLHGKKLKAILEDDPYWYYEGRFTINEWKSDQHYSLITIDYDVYPFKKELTASNEDWLWDPFDFEYGVINEGASIVMSDSPMGTAVSSYTLIGSPEPQYLVIYVTDIGGNPDALMFTIGGRDVHLVAGRNVIYDVVVPNGQLTISAKRGGATLTIQYRRGSL